MRTSPVEGHRYLSCCPLPASCGGPEGKELVELVSVLSRGCCHLLYSAPDMPVSLINPSLHFKERIGSSRQEDLYARTLQLHLFVSKLRSPELLKHEIVPVN